MLEKTPGAVSFFGSPAWRANVVWFKVTGDLRTQGWGVARAEKENIRFKLGTRKALVVGS